ncbi:zinc finger and BTB domain-containing protein 44 [Microdochium nivale]|nr:zinc finger and BTB domain-containing protein 44 [Microdochium nivale]
MEHINDSRRQRSFYSLPEVSEDVQGSLNDKQYSGTTSQISTPRPTSPVNRPSVVEPPQPHLSNSLRHYPSMSAMTAMPFDSRMDFGAARDSYAWPGLDPNAHFLDNNFCSMGPSSDGDFTSSSVYSRSITSSPPHPILTAEQRELKRQRDMARRNSKTSIRSHRAMSDYRASQSPSLPMHEYNAGPSMAVYTSPQPQLLLLPEPVTALPGVSTYMSSAYTASPPLSEQQSAMFPTSYDYLGIGYNSGYTSSSSSLPNAHSHATFTSQYRPPTSTQDHPGLMYPAPSSMVQIGEGSLMPATGSTASEPGHVRVVQTRPKPQCWEHGCNGRQFSTFSNLLRHQREKSGQASKSSCPNCGAEFTRTTARNGHLLHDKCKERKNSA